MIDTIEMPVQVNGKLRALIDVPKGATADQAYSKVINDPIFGPKLVQIMSGEAIAKVIHVPDRLINIITF